MTNESIRAFNKYAANAFILDLPFDFRNMAAFINAYRGGAGKELRIEAYKYLSGVKIKIILKNNEAFSFTPKQAPDDESTWPELDDMFAHGNLLFIERDRIRYCFEKESIISLTYSNINVF